MTTLLQSRFDDATMGAFLRQLEAIESEVQRTEYPELPFAEGTIVPIDSTPRPGVRTVTYRKLTNVGKFALVRSYTTTIPNINTLSEEFTQAIHKWAGGYYIYDDDIEAASMGNWNLEQEDIAGVEEVAMQELNRLIAFGADDLNMPGFINHPEFMQSFSPYTLNSASTANQILSVLHDSVTAIVKLSKMIEQPDTLLLPLTQYHYLSNTRIDGVLAITILKQFLDTSAYIKDIFPLNELEGAGVNGTDAMVIYKRDPKKVKARYPQELKWEQMERQGLGYQRPATFRYGGIVAYRPYSVHVVSGI